MRKSAIKDIFYGLKGYRESMMITKETENLNIVCATYDELKKRLNPELFQLHQKFVDALEGN